MNNLLIRPRFSGAVLVKLVGITETQFLNLRRSGLMIDKPRYSLQDVFFVALCNDFRTRANKSWLSIIKLFERVFKDLETAKNIDFFKEIISFTFDDDVNNYEYLGFDDPLANGVFKKFEDTKYFMFDSFCFTIGDCEMCYINLLKIRLTVINRAKELDLKVDVEQVLLSA
jgi:hypothetical protein